MGYGSKLLATILAESLLDLYYISLAPKLQKLARIRRSDYQSHLLLKFHYGNSWRAHDQMQHKFSIDEYNLALDTVPGELNWADSSTPNQQEKNELN